MTALTLSPAPSLSSVGVVSREFCDMWETYGKGFDIRIMESAGYHLLLWATIAEDPDLVVRLSPPYEAFIAHSGNNLEILDILTDAITRDVATIEAILALQWPSTVDDKVQGLRNHVSNTWSDSGC